MEDTFWLMWYHLDAVMTPNVHDGGQMHCFYHCLLIEISFDLDVIKQWVGVVFEIIEVVEFKNVKTNHVTFTDELEIWGQTYF